MMKIIFFFATIMAMLQADAQTYVEQQSLFNINILAGRNPGFENKFARWAKTGTATVGYVTNSNANWIAGNATLKFDATSGATLASQLALVPGQLRGQNCSARFIWKGGDSSTTVQVLNGDAEQLGSTLTLSNVGSESKTGELTFPCPTQAAVTADADKGNLQLKFTFASTVTLYLDTVKIGTNDNIGSVSQSQFIGSAYFATTSSCTWSRTNTALGAFSTTSACPGPTVELNPGPGVIQTTDADLPRVTVNNLPAGTYAVVVDLTAYVGTAGNIAAFAITDGTTTSGRCGGSETTSSTDFVPCTITSYFTYTSSGNRTFDIHGAAQAGSVTIANVAALLTTRFSIVRFPGVGELALRTDMTQAYAVKQWFGTATTATVGASAAASATRSTPTSANWASYTYGGLAQNDSSQNLQLTASLPAGDYMVKFNARMGAIVPASGTNFTGCAFEIYDGTSAVASTYIAQNPQVGAAADNVSSIIGYVKLTTASTKTYSVRIAKTNGDNAANAYCFVTTDTALSSAMLAIVPMNQNIPAPLLVGSITSNSTGAERAERVTILCGASSSITRQSGTWVSSVGNMASGNCALTIASGIFSGTPTCTASIDTAAGFGVARIVTTSATSVTTGCWFVAGGGTSTNCSADTTIDVLCHGPRN